MTLPPAAAETLWMLGPLPVTNAMVNGWIAVIFFVIVAGMIRIGVKTGMFKGLVFTAEAIVEWLLSEAQKVTGDRARAMRFLPIVGASFLLILFSNWLGQMPGTGSMGIWLPVRGELELVPLLRPATSDVNFTLALGMGAVLATHIFGFTFLGFADHMSKFVNVRGIGRALKKGPIALLTAFIELGIGLIELIGEVAKILSLCLRLFGNIFAGEVLMTVMLGLFAYAIPLPFMALEILVGMVQATVFAMLTLAYLTVATDRHGHEAESSLVRQRPLLASQTGKRLWWKKEREIEAVQA